MTRAEIDFPAVHRNPHRLDGYIPVTFCMPPLASYPYVVVRLGCSRCGREGQFRLAPVWRRSTGAEIDLTALLAHLAGDCAMWGRQRHPFKEQCGAFFIDNGSSKPPDLPAAMRGLRVVR
jgi:hypothetical protein